MDQLPIASEITVHDGHLSIHLTQLEDGWHARVDSAIEGRIFDGHVTELSDLLVGHDSGHNSQETEASN